MTAGMRNSSRAARSALILVAAGVLAVGCGSGSGSSGAGGGSSSGTGTGAAGQVVPTAHLPVLKSIGKGEGTLNLIAWEGYLQPQWVKPFENQTGCQVHATYAGTSDQMVALMKNGGGGQYDMVSSSGDADLRIRRRERETDDSDAHQPEGEQHGGLAADAVAPGSDQNGADGTADKTHAECGQR